MDFMSTVKGSLLEGFYPEAREAGKLAGIEVLDGLFGDLDIYADNAESRDKVVEVIQYAQPDVIITHNPDDYMPDPAAAAVKGIESQKVKF